MIKLKKNKKYFRIKTSGSVVSVTSDYFLIGYLIH